MKRFLSLCLALVLAFSLTACGGSSASSSAVPKDYAAIIKAARADDYNEAYPIIAGGEVVHNPLEMADDEKGSYVETIWALTGLEEANMQTYALSISLINIRAYAVAIIMPAEGKTDAVTANLQEYVTGIQKSFENYLPDQYEIAKDAVVRTAKTGEIILVIDENASALADTLEAELVK